MSEDFSTIDICFHRLKVDYWNSESLSGLKIEVMRFDASWLATATLTYNPYGEYLNNDWSTEADDYNLAVEKLLNQSGIAHALGLTDIYEETLASVYAKINIFWGNSDAYVVGTPQNNVPEVLNRLNFREGNDGKWQAYYRDKCSITVERKNERWIATANPISATLTSESIKTFQSEDEEIGNAVYTLLSIPGIPFLFGLTKNTNTRLKKFTQKMHLIGLKYSAQPTMQEQIIPGCPLQRSICEFAEYVEPCPECNKYASWGWAYSRRWDD